MFQRTFGVFERTKLIGIVRGEIFREPFNWTKALQNGLSVFIVDLHKALQFRELQKKFEEKGEENGRTSQSKSLEHS